MAWKKGLVWGVLRVYTESNYGFHQVIIPNKQAMRQGFPGGSEVKASASNTGDPGSIPRLGRSPGEGNGNPLQYSCLENPMDGEA